MESPKPSQIFTPHHSFSPWTSKPEHAGVPYPLLCDCCRASAPRYEFAMRRPQTINNYCTDSPHRSTFHQMVLAASQLEEQIPRFGDRLFYVGVPVDTHESIHSNKPQTLSPSLATRFRTFRVSIPAASKVDRSIDFQFRPRIRRSLEAML